MVLVPWRCYKELSCFVNEMNQLFDRFFGNESIDRPWEKALYLPLSLSETEDDILVNLEIRGFSPEEIEITFREDVLVIRGEKGKDEKVKTEQFQYMQKESGSFVRTIRIQKKINTDAIEARYKNGKLIIRLPKAKKKPAFIRINVE